MRISADAHVPLVFGDAGEAGPDDAVLAEGHGAKAPGREYFVPRPPASFLPGHAAGCTCCMPRTAAGQALGRLLLARGRGTAPFFRRILVVVETELGRNDVIAALRADPVAAPSFRHDE